MKGAFQPNPGSSACFNCPDGKTTRKKGAQTQADCIHETPAEWMDKMTDYFSGDYLMYAIIGGCVLAAILCLWILVCCCWPNSRVGKILTCAACCGEPQDEGNIKSIPDDRRRLRPQFDDDDDYY